MNAQDIRNLSEAYMEVYQNLDEVIGMNIILLKMFLPETRGEQVQEGHQYRKEFLIRKLIKLKVIPNYYPKERRQKTKKKKKNCPPN